MSMKATIQELTAEGAFFEVRDIPTARGDLPGYAHAPQTLTEIIQNARGHGDLGFIVSGDTRLTFAEFFARADSLRAYLEGEGLTAGDRFAIAMRNNAEWLIGFTAAFLAGATVVPINSWGQAGELTFAVEDCGASWLLCDDQRASMLQESLPTERRLVVYDRAQPGTERGIDFSDALSSATPAEVEVPSARSGVSHSLYLRQHGDAQGCGPLPTGAVTSGIQHDVYGHVDHDRRGWVA